MLEIVVADSPLNNKKLHLGSNINYSPSLTYNPFYSKSEEQIFTWKNKNTNKIKSDYSITDILEDCGYSFDPKKHKKENGNLVFINLISPRIGYRNQSKTSIHLKPFASSAQEIFNFLKVISSRNKNGIKKGDIINELRDLIEERIEEVKYNPRVKEIGRWTQSTIFYYLRPILIDKGLEAKTVGKKRKYITGIIKKVCNELGENIRGKGFKRYELGIIAAERAQLYFKGQSLGVGFDQLEELAKKGTDLLIIEKEGVADVLAPFADQKGIAILNTRGFLTEYAEDLSELAEKEECNIAILTDFDSSGLVIASSLSNTHRIGIDFKTLEKLDLDREDVEEEGNESDNHLTNLKKMEYEIPRPYDEIEWDGMIEYLDSGKRIEIDSVLRVIGNEKFWNFVMKELDSVFSKRDYNRAVDIPEYVPPKEIDDLFAKIKNIISEYQTDERENISDELVDIEGFIDVKTKEEEIKDRLRTNVQDDSDVKNKILDVIKNFSFNN
jgi:5S rRNA maturation endonuclease (ribonuclease M5)